jgi:predicted GNAT superfamily acetyltransferase
MSIVLRDVEEKDLEVILRLNNDAGASILPIEMARLEQLERVARYFRVAEVDGEAAGFLVGLTPEADYDSPNFLWFRARYGDSGFLYIDRVVVADRFRRHGIGRVLYCDVLSFAEVRFPTLSCEVFIEPRDDVSLIFFGTNDFSEVGQQQLPGGRQVSLMTKPLRPFQFVQESYLRNGHARQLPAYAREDRMTRREQRWAERMSA